MILSYNFIIILNLKFRDDLVYERNQKLRKVTYTWELSALNKEHNERSEVRRKRK